MEQCRTTAVNKVTIIIEALFIVGTLNYFYAKILFTLYHLRAILEWSKPEADFAHLVK
jgi:hypothetical protein